MVLCLRGGFCSGDLPPDMPSVCHLLAIVSRPEPMTSGTEVGQDRPMCREEALRVPRRLESAHRPFPLAGRLVGIFRAVVEVSMLSMFHARQDLSLGRAITFELVCDNHPRNVRQALEEFPEEFLGSVLVTSPLHEDVEDISVLIYGTPQILPLAIDGQEDLIQVPLISRSRASAT
jgi:hypothetical protein